MSGFVITSCISAGTTCKCSETHGEKESKQVEVKERQKEKGEKERGAMLLEEMREWVDWEVHGDRGRGRERGRQASWRQRSHLSHPIYLIQRLLKNSHTLSFEKDVAQTKQTEQEYSREMGGAGGGGAGWSSGVRACRMSLLCWKAAREMSSRCVQQWRSFPNQRELAGSRGFFKDLLH